MEDTICPNQPYGQHITVRCRGCNSIHSTKNIGGRSGAGVVGLSRSLFDTMGCICICKDKGEHPLIHICEIDDNLRYEFQGFDLRNGKHYAKTPEARAVLQSWWKQYAESISKPVDQETLDELVLLGESKATTT